VTTIRGHTGDFAEDSRDFHEISQIPAECSCDVTDFSPVTRPPLKAVAALAGVSEPTVSRVLNGRMGVAAATRHRVVVALRELGFHGVPEPRSDRRNTIGIVGGEFLNPVFPTLTHHISFELGRRGYLATVAITDRDLVPEERCVAELTDYGVDGIVFLGGRHAELDGRIDHYRDLAESGTPVVLVNGIATDLKVPHVRCDEGAGARKAVTHLIRLGHRRIGCVLGAERYIPTVRFIEGYRQTLAAHDIVEPDGAIVDAPFTMEGGRAAARRLIERGFTAMICGNDLMALGAVLAATSFAGTHTDISVVGYDGTEFTAHTSPPLTTLRQPFEDMARLVCDAIISEIDGTRRFRDHFVFEPQLLSRESTHPHKPVQAGV
jgi:LacI family transcriptional regulator, repressor for deo operon, udp, cdd, tsx, nupC, and nupG